MSSIAFTILGEPASKANSRQLATIGPKHNRTTILRKGDKALDYERDALAQIPSAARCQLTCDVRVTLRIFYATRRPDLDESIVLDVLQDRWSKAKKGPDGSIVKPKVLLQRGVYVNDRQVREKHVYHGIDKANPRTEIVVEPIEAVQQEIAA
jgi:Holliday junction resolvase RusA-like endonuclease